MMLIIYVGIHLIIKKAHNRIIQGMEFKFCQNTA